MTSLGELFISLGFDVEDTKLENFTNKLRGAHEQMMRLGRGAAEAVGVIATASAGMYSFMQNSENAAVKLNNMRFIYGANTQAVQTYANAVHQLNSQISVSAAQESYGKFSQMVLGKIPIGQGAAGALALLGGDYNPGTGQTPQDVFDNLARHYDESKKQWGAAYGVYLEPTGLSEQAIAQRAHDPAAYAAAGQYNIPEGHLDNWGKLAKDTGELDEAFNHFKDGLIEMAGLLDRGVRGLTSGLNYLAAFNKEHPGAATTEIGGALGLGALGGWALVRKFFAGRAAAAAGGTALEAFAAEWNLAAAGTLATAGGVSTGAVAALLAAGAAATWGAGWVGGKIGESLKGSGSAGASSTLSPGIIKRLMDESNMNPAAVGDGGKAYGIAQWHPDRQRLYKFVMGHDIHGSSVEDQMQFVNWELMHGDPGARRAGRELDKAQTEADKYRIFTKYYERPMGASNIQITVNSNADPKTVAMEVKRELQNVTNTANSQTNLNF